MLTIIIWFGGFACRAMGSTYIGKNGNEAPLFVSITYIVFLALRCIILFFFIFLVVGVI